MVNLARTSVVGKIRTAPFRASNGGKLPSVHSTTQVCFAPKSRRQKCSLDYPTANIKIDTIITELGLLPP